jgi:hypothetical protein
MKRVILFAALAFFLPDLLFAEDAHKPLQVLADFRPGRITIDAERSEINFEKSIYALVFRQPIGENENVPEWKRIGNLIVDSIWLPDSAFEISSEDQLNGIYVSQQMSDVINVVSAYMILKCAPGFDPKDTLWPGPTDTVILHDIGRFYEIRFPDTLSLDSAMRIFESASGVKWVGKVEIPEPDGN